MPALPNITQGQMALDPVNQIIYYKTQADELKSVTLKWLQDSSNTIDTTDTVVVGGDFIITGNLTVNGTTATLNTESILVEDNFLILNSNVSGIPSTNAGIEIERGSYSNVSIRWNESSDKWEYTNDGITFYSISDISLNQINNLSDVDINSPANGDFLRYNGTNWINDPVNLSTDTVGEYVAKLAAGTGIVITNNSGEGSTPNISFNGSIDNVSDVLITAAANGQTLIYDGTNWVNTTFPSGEPIGHETKDASVISFNESTREFSISPASGSYTVWCTGKRYVKTSTEKVTIPDTSGLYYIYFNSSGSLAYKTTYFTWDQDTPTAYIYWNDVDNKAYFFADERHGVTLDWQTHEYLHRTRGAVIADGFGVNNYSTTGDGSLDAHAKIDLANGTFFDEDMQIDIVHSASPVANTWQQRLQNGSYIPVFYHSGSAWKKDTATQFPFKQGTSRAQYNLNTAGSWSTVDIDNAKFGVMFIVATNNLNEPVISILGQGQYTDKGSAEEVIWEDLDLTGFPVFEFRPLYKLVFQTATAYSNTPKVKIVSVSDLRRIGSSGSSVPAGSVSDHGLMTGLADDDHLQYLNTTRHDELDHSTVLISASIGDLGDVTITSATPNQSLIWNGSAWVNTTSPVPLKYTATIGNAVDLSYIVIHDLGTRDIILQARNVNSPYESYFVAWEPTTINSATVYFDFAPGLNSVRIVIIG